MGGEQWIVDSADAIDSREDEEKVHPDALMLERSLKALDTLTKECEEEKRQIMQQAVRFLVADRDTRAGMRAYFQEYEGKYLEKVELSREAARSSEEIKFPVGGGEEKILRYYDLTDEPYNSKPVIPIEITNELVRMGADYFLGKYHDPRDPGRIKIFFGAGHANARAIDCREVLKRAGFDNTVGHAPFASAFIEKDKIHGSIETHIHLIIESFQMIAAAVYAANHSEVSSLVGDETIGTYRVILSEVLTVSPAVEHELRQRGVRYAFGAFYTHGKGDEPVNIFLSQPSEEFIDIVDKINASPIIQRNPIKVYKHGNHIIANVMPEKDGRTCTVSDVKEIMITALKSALLDENKTLSPT